MANIFDVVKEIKSRGHDVKTEVVEKNGTMKTGITFTDTESKGRYQVYPVFYTDAYGNESADKVAQDIIERYLKNYANLTVPDLHDWGSVKDKLYLCVQKDTSDETCLVRSFIDLQAYVRIIINDSMTVRVNRKLIDLWGVTEDEVWKQAEVNTEKELISMRMVDIIGGAIKIGDFEYASSQYVLTNRKQMYGAAFIWFKDRIKNIAEEFGEDIYILPSSIHEVLAIPVSYVEDPISLKKMVLDINEDADLINNEDVLSCSIYRYSLDADVLYVEV